MAGPQKMDSSVDRIRNKQGISAKKKLVEKMHKNALGTGIAIYQVFYYASTLPCHDYLANASNNSRKILTDLLSEGINLSFHQM